jgi:hypothetical protein
VKVRLDLDKCWNIARTQSFYYECGFRHREVWTKDGGGLDKKTRVVLDFVRMVLGAICIGRSRGLGRNIGS